MTEERVLSTRVGYTGGNTPNATYRNHGAHAEAVELVFDPAKISYRQIRRTVACPIAWSLRGAVRSGDANVDCVCAQKQKSPARGRALCRVECDA